MLYQYDNKIDTKVCAKCGRARTKDWFTAERLVCKRCYDLDKTGAAEAEFRAHQAENLDKE